MESTDLFTQELLATTGRRIYNKFLNLEERLEASRNVQLSQEQFINEFQRFSLWATNLGLYHAGHSSLDYRFRDAPSVADFAKRLLKDLEKNLSISKSESLTVHAGESYSLCCRSASSNLMLSTTSPR